MDYLYLRNSSVEKTKTLLSEWIRLYPESFHFDTKFELHQIDNERVVVVLDDCISSLAVCLLVNYFAYDLRDTDTKVEAFITIDDSEVLPNTKEGQRARVFVDKATDDYSRVSLLTEKSDLFVFTYKKKAEATGERMGFSENLPVIGDAVETIRVGDIIPAKNVEKPDAFSANTIKWYLIIGAVGLAIGFAIAYLRHPELF